MVFSKEWDTLYKNEQHLSIWPWSHIVSLSLRHSKLKQSDKTCKVLEIGCGAGANIPFINSYSHFYHGIDGSEHVIEKLKKQFPQLVDNLVVGDFTKDIPFDNKFDLIIDRAASTHNNTPSIKNLLKLLQEKLTDDGVIIITDWFSSKHEQFELGNILGDKYTRSGYQNGAFKGVGIVHFFDEEHIRDLVADFNLVHLEHEVIDVVYPQKNLSASWNLVIKKRDNF